MLEKLTEGSVLAKPDTLQVYSFNGVGGVSDQLPMKPKKSAKGVSNYPFLFLETKHQRSKFESAYSEKLQIVILDTKHTVTTPNGNIIHRKNISKPITDFVQENSNRGNRPRGPDGRFTKLPSKPKRMAIVETESEPEAPPMETESPKTPELSDNATFKKRTKYRCYCHSLTATRLEARNGHPSTSTWTSGGITARRQLNNSTPLTEHQPIVEGGCRGH